MPFKRFISTISHSFGLKVYISLVAAMIIIGGLLNYIHNIQDKRNFKAVMIHDGLMMAELIAEAAQDGFISENTHIINHALNPAFNVKGVIEACALNIDKEQLSRIIDPEFKTVPSQCLATIPQKENNSLLEKVLQSKKSGFIEDEKIIEFWAPVLTDGHEATNEDPFLDSHDNNPHRLDPIGYIGLTMDKVILEAEIRSVVKNNILTLIVALIIGAFIAFFIVRSVHSPLAQLVEKMKHHGEESVPKDELDLLSSTYDSLIHELETNFSTIQRLQFNLEEKIKELKKEILSHVETGAALYANEKKYRTLVETIKDIVYTLDNEAILTYVSPVVETLTGYKPEELIGTPFLQYIGPEDRNLAIGKFREGVTNLTTVSYEGRFIKKDGTSMYLEVNGSPLVDSEGTVIGRIGSARDITRRKKEDSYRKELEIKAMTHAKLASLGEIATGMAHEINQPLSYVKVVYESALTDIERNQVDHDELTRDFTEALYQIGRITKIVNHLRTFGHSQEQHFSEVDLKKALSSTKTIMESKIKKADITIYEHLADDLPTIQGNSVNLEQIFINLMQNSLTALIGRENAEISITIENEKDFIVIKFADNGPGIPAEIQARIFEPFFTTKEVGQGTGLGLSILYGIVEEHNGTIDVESKPGEGTLFTITLPVENNTNNSTNGRIA